MRLVPCSPPAGIAYDALVDAPVTSIASALLAQDAAARGARGEPAWQAYWDLSEESGPYYLRADAGAESASDLRVAPRPSEWYRIDVQDELEARGADADGRSVQSCALHAASVCLVGRWRRGEAAPVLYARETVQARVRAHGARRAAAAAASGAASAGALGATSAAAGPAAGDRLVGHGVADA